MTRNPHTASEDDTLESVVTQMERYRVKRLPVMRDGRMVGIVSRANLMHALASLAREAPAASGDDAAIRDRILEALAKQHWALAVNVVVKNGIAEIWGTIMDERERQAVMVAVENVPGVKQVHDHLVWIEPMSGMAFPSAEDEAHDATGASMQFAPAWGNAAHDCGRFGRNAVHAGYFSGARRHPDAAGPEGFCTVACELRTLPCDR